VPDPDLEFKKKLAMAHQCMVRHYYFPAFKFQKKIQKNSIKKFTSGAPVAIVMAHHMVRH
jgi:hypothetical protein